MTASRTGDASDVPLQREVRPAALQETRHGY